MRYNDRERRERFALARAFESSKMTKAEYCRRHGMSVSTFDYWRSEAAKEEAGAVEAAFFEIQVADSKTSAPQLALQPDLEVELPLGVKLRFFGTAVAK